MIDNTLLFNAVARKKSLACVNSFDKKICASKEFLLNTAHTSLSRFRFRNHQAKETLKNITELRDLIIQKRAEYIRSSSVLPFFGESSKLLKESNPRLSSNECKLFDEFTDIAIRQCSSLIHKFQKKIIEDEVLRLEDESRHLRLVAHSLRIYLRDVCDIVVKMREVKKACIQRRKKFGRLKNLVDMWEDVLPMQDRMHLNFVSYLEKDSECQPKFKGMLLKLEKEATIFQLEKLQEENTRLLKRLASADPEIQLIENRLVEIQQLQDLFNEKILEQDREIDMVHTKAGDTLDTLGDANLFLRRALCNKASRRVIALFSLIVLSFTLLFVDWYNP